MQILEILDHLFKFDARSEIVYGKKFSKMFLKCWAFIHQSECKILLYDYYKKFFLNYFELFDFDYKVIIFLNSNVVYVMTIVSESG